MHAEYCGQRFDSINSHIDKYQNLKQMKVKKQKGKENKDKEKKELYDLSTPLWDKYYQKVRRSVRFPRYYKESLNW